MAPYTRTAIQMGVAVGAAIALGVVVSGDQFYWAVIAAFITFMGTNNSGEQARKATFRVLGTVVGIGIGSLLVTVFGHHTYWSIAVILVSLFFGFYLMRINYAFMGITVMVSQLYVQLGEFSNSLLLLRLEETALGGGSASLFDQAGRHLEGCSTAGYADRLAVRDLMLIDQAMATMAELMDLDVTDLDSTKVRPAGAAPINIK